MNSRNSLTFSDIWRSYWTVSLHKILIICSYFVHN
nr:MAG TPA: STELLO glycosyltransferase [Caudoviricetes sp.]